MTLSGFPLGRCVPHLHRPGDEELVAEGANHCREQLQHQPQWLSVLSSDRNCDAVAAGRTHQQQQQHHDGLRLLEPALFLVLLLTGVVVRQAGVTARLPDRPREQLMYLRSKPVGSVCDWNSWLF